MTNEEIKARLEILETERKTADELVVKKAADLRDARFAADALYNEYFKLIGELEARENEAFEAKLQAEGKTLPRTPDAE